MTSPPRPQCQPAAKPGVGVSPPRHVLGGEGPLRTRSDQQSGVNDEALCGPGVTSSGLRGLAEAPRGPTRTARAREWGRGLGLNPKRGRGRQTRPGGLGTVAQPSWGPVRAAHPSNGVGRRCRPQLGVAPEQRRAGPGAGSSRGKDGSGLGTGERPALPSRGKPGPSPEDPCASYGATPSCGTAGGQGRGLRPSPGSVPFR